MDVQPLELNDEMRAKVHFLVHNALAAYRTDPALVDEIAGSLLEATFILTRGREMPDHALPTERVAGWDRNVRSGG